MASTPKKKLPFQKRARSVPFKRPFLIAVAITSVYYLFTLGALTALAGFIVLRTKEAAYTLIGLVAVALLIWTISPVKRRDARCPLCKGSPYLNTGAHLHEKATKLPILNHGHSNVFRTIFAQNFRCMYCGTPYDFLKPVSDPIHR